MTIDCRSVLFAPIYATFGVMAELTLGSGAVFDDLTVLDCTKGQRLPLMPALDVETLGPVAYLLAGELDDRGIADSEVDDSTLAFNGKTWRIDAHRPMPSWNGELDGQIMLLLERTA